MNTTLRYRSWAFNALRSAAFEEQHGNRPAADFWRVRAALWFRRASEARQQLKFEPSDA